MSGNVSGPGRTEARVSKTARRSRLCWIGTTGRHEPIPDGHGHPSIGGGSGERHGVLGHRGAPPTNGSANPSANENIVDSDDATLPGWRRHPPATKVE